jgi:hypothetical protein
VKSSAPSVRKVAASLEIFPALLSKRLKERRAKQAAFNAELDAQT